MCIFNALAIIDYLNKTSKPRTYIQNVSICDGKTRSNINAKYHYVMRDLNQINLHFEYI